MSEGVAGSFAELLARVPAERLQGLDGSYVFRITDAGPWTLRIAAGELTFTEGAADSPDGTLSASADAFRRLLGQELRPLTALMTGQLRIGGDMNAVMRLQTLFSGSS